MRVRIGINLGSVKLVRDINGNMAAAGDGINKSASVYDEFRRRQSNPGFASQYYEVASLLTEGYGALFRADGVRKDKHQREHMLYELHLPNEAASRAHHQHPDHPAASRHSSPRRSPPWRKIWH